MKTVLLKSTSSGALTLQHPGARIGVSPGEAAITYAITDVPEDVTPAEVLRLAQRTAITCGFVIEFDKLGAGKIAKGALEAAWAHKFIPLGDTELSHCERCGGFEGGLTTHCCGRPVTEKETTRIYTARNLDFKFGKWVEEPGMMGPLKEPGIYNAYFGESITSFCEKLEALAATAPAQGLFNKCMVVAAKGDDFGTIHEYWLRNCRTDSHFQQTCPPRITHAST